MSNPHKGKSIHALIAEDVKGDAGYLVEELTMGFQRGESPEWFTPEMVDLLWGPGASSHIRDGADRALSEQIFERRHFNQRGNHVLVGGLLAKRLEARGHRLTNILGLQIWTRFDRVNLIEDPTLIACAKEMF